MSSKNNQLFIKIVKESKQKHPPILLAINPETWAEPSVILVGGEASHRPGTTTEKLHVKP